jgi:hypothetical protein
MFRERSSLLTPGGIADGDYVMASYYGVAWFTILRYGLCCGMVWYGVTYYGAAWRTTALRCGMLWYVKVWYDMMMRVRKCVYVVVCTLTLH